MSRSPISRIVIVSPTLADANTGNWQTARRWARFLRTRYRVRIARDWAGEADDAMIARYCLPSGPM